MTPLEQLGREAAETQQQLLEERGALREVRARLLAKPSRGAPRRWVWAFASAGAAAAIALVVLLTTGSGSAPLTFDVDGEPGRIGQWLAAEPSASVNLAFSDGTTFALGDGAAGRVERVDRRGARFLLERGRALVDVEPMPEARWELGVGPFELIVLGTRFTVSWDADREVFHLSMEEGAVTVTGPNLLQGRVVRAGEVISVWRSSGQTLLRAGRRLGPEDDEPPLALLAAAASEDAGSPVDEATPPVVEVPRAPEVSPATPAPPPLQEARPSISPRSAGAPRPPSPPSHDEATAEPASAPPTAESVRDESSAPSWQDLSRQGRFAEAMAAAEAEGWEGLLAGGSAGQLMRLADTARLAGRTARASDAYHRVRRRYPSSASSAAAAFQLGRLAFDRGGAPAEAARWFQTSLRERSSGRFARESLGRLIEARRRSGDRAGAREASRRYLDRYPEGPHAPLARSLVAP